jgi:hypothetical protein
MRSSVSQLDGRWANRTVFKLRGSEAAIRLSLIKSGKKLVTVRHLQ